MDTHQSFIERYLTPIAVVVGAIILAAAYVFGHGTAPATTATTGTAGAPAAVDVKNVKTAGEPYVGDPNAPVTMAFYFDYQCPFCKQFDTTAMGQLYTNYVETGKLRIVFKDFQFLGADSMTGAEFGHALWDLYPDKFYTWFEAMFAAQDEEGDQGFGNLDSIIAMTKQQVPGVDTDKVVALMNQKKADYDAAIQASQQEGTALGVQGTPAFIVGTQILSGAQPYATVAAAIDAALK